MRTQGFILMTLLFMISILSMLMFANMRLITLAHKRQSQWYLYQERKMQLEQVAEHLAKTVGQGALSCVMSFDALPTSILQRGCPYAKHYRYVVTDLGEFPCVQVLKANIPLNTHHWLLTVIDQRLQAYKIQIRIATVGREESCTEDKQSHIPLGILTWHYG